MTAMAAKKLQPKALECTRAATIAVHAAAGLARGTAAARLIRAAEGLLRSATSLMLESQQNLGPMGQPMGQQSRGWSGQSYGLVGSFLDVGCFGQAVKG